MGKFSTTLLPPNKMGWTEAAYPMLVQVTGELWMLLEEFSYTTDAGKKFTAPKGMLTDLASIPQPLWNIMPPFGKYTGAAVIHDYLYQTQIVTKEEADHVLAEAMDANGVPHVERMAIYDGVKFGGQAAWDGHTAELLGKG